MFLRRQVTVYLALTTCRAELKRDVAVRVCSAITSGLNIDAYCARFLYPLLRAQREGRQTCLNLKVVKFDHFEIWVEHYLPRSQKLKRRATAYPVFYVGYLITITGTIV